MILNATTFKKSPEIKAVVFDLDDTLYPEREYAMSGFRAVARYVQTVFGADIHNDLVNAYEPTAPEKGIINALCRHFEHVEASFARNVLHVFRTHRPQIELYPDARVALALLFRQNICTAAVTVGNSGIQERKIIALGLNDLLDNVTHTDALLRSVDPNHTCPDAFEVVALMLGVELCEMLFVGDNPLTDFLIPKQMGITTVRIGRRYGTYATLEPPSHAHAPDITIDSLELLVELPPPDQPTSAMTRLASALA